MARRTGSHAQITEPKVRAAALSLFARHGFAAVSMRQIAAEVGVQAGALYSYTPDKQSLLFDLMRGHMDDLLAAWGAKTLPGDPGAALEAFTRFHISYHLDRPDAVFIAYMELRNLTEANFAVIEKLRSDYEAHLQRILDQGADAGVFDVPDSKVATRAIIAMLTGLTTWYREDGRLPKSRIEDLYVGLARRAVGAT